MAVAGVVTSFFILVVVLIYSTIVWKSLDQYFKEEFKKHLEQDKNYKRLQKEKLVSMNNIESIEKSVDRIMFDEGNLAVKRGGCNKEKVPADKYKNREDDDDEYLDDNEVCPFVLLQDENDNTRR